MDSFNGFFTIWNFGSILLRHTVISISMLNLSNDEWSNEFHFYFLSISDCLEFFYEEKCHNAKKFSCNGRFFFSKKGCVIDWTFFVIIVTLLCMNISEKMI